MLMSNPFSVEESGCYTRSTCVLCVYILKTLSHKSLMRDLPFRACLAVCW